MGEDLRGQGRGLEQLCAVGAATGQSERELLDRFLVARDPVAFEAIVARHGPMVVRVCQSLLTDPTDVDDAFQATFLVLTRKANSLRDRDGLSPWLHGVARRVSLQARAEARRRAGVTRAAEREPAAFDPSLRHPEERELAALLHAEIDRLALPERSAVLLCDLEGLTHQEAADQLGWPLGTVKSRVARGRERLRSRLVRRGVSLSIPTLASLLASEAGAGAVVAPGLLASTARAALAAAAARSVALGLISAPVFSLTQGAIRAMLFTQIKVLALGLAATAVVVAVPGVIAYQGGQRPPAADPTPVERPDVTATKIASPAPVAPARAPAVPAADSSAFDLAILKKLEGPNPLKQALARFNGGGPTATLQAPSFEEAMGFLTEATVDPAAGLPTGIAIRFTGIGKRVAAANRTGTVAGLVAGDPSTPLRVVLTSEAARHGLDYRVAGGVLTFDESQVDGPGQAGIKAEVRQRILDDDQRNEQIRAKLDRVVPLHFATKVPLSEFVRYIKEATRDADGKSIPIYVDPRINNNPPEQGANPRERGEILIELDDVPLRTSLRLALVQLDLEYVVSGGLLIIGARPEAANNFGGGMGNPPTRGIGDLVDPRDRGMGGMGGFR